MALDRKLWLGRLRTAGLAAAALLAVYIFLTQVSDHYAIKKWLFWRYALCWVLCAAWAAACVSAGHATLLMILKRPLPIVEHAVTSFAVGVYEFFLALFVGGLLGLYGRVFFIALPVLFLGLGAKSVLRYGARLVRHIRYRRARARPAPWWALPVTAFGLLGVLMVYFVILTPDNVSFDSRWMHLAIAEHYVAAGAVRPFPEGWYPGTIPHLSSFLYTWAFMLPWGSLFDRVEMAAHLEFTVFLGTLAGIPALVRILIPGARARCSWVVRFLFPGVFLYDSSLAVGADHIAALFAVPIFTLLVRARRELAPRYCALLAMMLSGVILTKLSGAFLLLPFPAAVIAFRSISLAIASLRRRAPLPLRAAWIKGPAVLLAGGLTFTAPHWLKNIAWYGSPLYPTLYSVWPGRPWSPIAEYLYVWIFDAGLWHPEKTRAGLKESLKALFTFSFVPNDWATFHGVVPVFGSLFTLMLLCMPFLRGGKRLWGLFIAIYMGLFAWYWTHHQDRYLQTILPWMAAATASALLLAWRSGLAVRVPIAALVGVQIIWGGDAYFIPTHAMTRSPVKDVVDLIATGYKKDFNGRERVYGAYYDIGKYLPKRSKVLVHDMGVHLGISAMSVSDRVGWQAGIDYGSMKSPREVYDLLSSYGVTHILWESGPSRVVDSVAAELMFFNFALRHSVSPKTFGNITVTSMPTSRPLDEFDDTVAALTCKKTYAPGLYRMKDLNVPAYGPRRSAFPRPFRTARAGEPVASLLREAAFAVVDSRCGGTIPQEERSSFVVASKRKEHELWIRTSPSRAKPPEKPDEPTKASEPTKPDEPAKPDEPDEPDSADSLFSPPR